MTDKKEFYKLGSVIYHGKDITEEVNSLAYKPNTLDEQIVEDTVKELMQEHDEWFLKNINKEKL